MLLRRLGAAFAVLASVLLVASADMKAVRFASVGNSYVCAARQLMDLPPQVDVVLLGSSRIRRGISPEQLAAQLGPDFQRVYNLGRPFRQILRSESIISYLIESGRIPKVVVLEADIDLFRFEPTGPWGLQPGEPGFLTYRELLAVDATTGEHDTGYLLARAVQTKVAQTASVHFSGLTARILASNRKKPPTVCWLDSYDVDDAKKQKKREKRAEELAAEGFDPDVSTDPRFVGTASVAAQVQIATIDRIRTRLSELGVTLVVIRPNGYLDPPLGTEVTDQIKALIPEYAVPPEPLVRQLSKLNIDHSHFGPEGRKLYTEWLAGVIKQRAVQP